MVSDFDRIVWSNEADKDLEEIKEFYEKYSPTDTQKVILKIILATNDITFSEQFQIDEIDPSCRRIVVEKSFKILYKKIQKTILITRVYPAKKLRKSLQD